MLQLRLQASVFLKIQSGHLWFWNPSSPINQTTSSKHQRARLFVRCTAVQKPTAVLTVTRWFLFSEHLQSHVSKTYSLVLWDVECCTFGGSACWFYTETSNCVLIHFISIKIVRVNVQMFCCAADNHSEILINKQISHSCRVPARFSRPQRHAHFTSEHIFQVFPSAAGLTRTTVWICSWLQQLENTDNSFKPLDQVCSWCTLRITAVHTLINTCYVSVQKSKVNVW